MTTSLGDAAQIRAIGEQIAEATIIKMREVERPKVEIPAPIKWAAAIVAALMTAGVIGLCFWMVTTLSEVQLAVKEVNTQLSARGAVDTRFNALEQRVSSLEQDRREIRQ